MFNYKFHFLYIMKHYSLLS